MALQQQTNQAIRVNHVVSPQPTEPPGVFPPFPASHSAGMGTTAHDQELGWPSVRSEEFGAIQPPTQEDIRCAHRVLMWFQRLSPYQQFPPPPTMNNPGLTFNPQTRPLPSGVGAEVGGPTVPGAPDVAALSHGTLLDPDDPQPGPPLHGPLLPTSPRVRPANIPPPPSLDNPRGLSVVLTPSRTHPKLFEHDVGKPIKFCVPIVLKRRGKLAQIFRVRFEPSPSVLSSHARIA